MLRIAVVSLAALLLTGEAFAAGTCPQRASVTDYLAKNYHEAPVAMGLANNGGVIEIFTSGDGTTWTILLTMPNGQTCMVAAGTGWEGVPLVATVEGPEA
jgi:hypothetical protein